MSIKPLLQMTIRLYGPSSCLYTWLNFSKLFLPTLYLQIMSQGRIRNESDIFSSIPMSPTPDILQQNWRKERRRAENGESRHPWVYCIVYLFTPSQSFSTTFGTWRVYLHIAIILHKNYFYGPQLYKRKWIVNENLPTWWLFISHCDVATCLNDRLNYK